MQQRNNLFYDLDQNKLFEVHKGHKVMPSSSRHRNSFFSLASACSLMSDQQEIIPKWQRRFQIRPAW